MDTYKNARLTPKGREEVVRAVVDGGLSKSAAARKYNTTPKTVAKWVGPFRKEGVDGQRDRSSRPLSSPSQIGLAKARDRGVSAAPRGISRPSSAYQRRASRAFSNAAASAGSPASSRRSHAPATNATIQARSSISTSRNLAASIASATASPGDVPAIAVVRGQAGNSFMSRSTTILESRARLSSPTKRRKAPLRS